MQALSDSVGEGGKNLVHDATLLQALLFGCRRPHQFDPQTARYLSSIDGDFGPKSKAALNLFQNENVFADTATGTSRDQSGAMAGLCRPEDETWRALLKNLDAALSELRVLTNSSVPYLAGSASSLMVSLARTDSEVFENGFRTKVKALQQEAHRRLGIVLDVCPQGSRRTFQEQYDLFVGATNVTNAGPGESNHNFGRAVDIGFKGLRWLRLDGTIEDNETWWLHRLSAQPKGGAKALLFWSAMRDVGLSMGLFRGPEADRPHLQAWSDAAVSMRRSLAGLLTSVSGMRWQAASTGYSCDFGSGGAFHAVGSAAQIWSRSGPITAQALTANGYTGPATGALAATASARDKLRAAFEAAEASWTSWQPL